MSNPDRPTATVLRHQKCNTCPAIIESRPYATGWLPPRWYEEGTDTPHSCGLWEKKHGDH